MRYTDVGHPGRSFGCVISVARAPLNVYYFGVNAAEALLHCCVVLLKLCEC
jgi:hypothetical protein